MVGWEKEMAGRTDSGFGYGCNGGLLAKRRIEIFSITGMGGFWSKVGKVRKLTEEGGKGGGGMQ